MQLVVTFWSFCHTCRIIWMCGACLQHLKCVLLLFRPFYGRTVGKHHLVAGFLKGARRLRPCRPNMMPVWELFLVLNAHSELPFESLVSTELKVLSFKTALLLASACGKRVGNLEALSTNAAYFEFSKMTVWSGCSLDEVMCLRCLLLHKERKSLRCRHLVLRLPSRDHIHFAQSMLCGFIGTGQVISEAALKGCWFDSGHLSGGRMVFKRHLC